MSYESLITTTAPPPSTCTSTTAQSPLTIHLLKTLTHAIFEAKNDLPSPAAEKFLLRHMAADWTMAYQGAADCALPIVHSRDDMIDMIKSVKKDHPTWRYEIFHVSAAMVGESGDFGTVQFSAKVSKNHDYELNPKQEMFGILFWRKKRDGIWECYRHEGMKGGGDFT